MTFDLHWYDGNKSQEASYHCNNQMWYWLVRVMRAFEMVNNSDGREVCVNNDNDKSYKTPGAKGIEGFKLVFNDAWHVTEKEIEEALELYHQKSSEEIQAVLQRYFEHNEDGPAFDKFLKFLTEAKDHGGFVVY